MSEQMYITWNNPKELTKAMGSITESIDNFGTVSRTHAGTRIFTDVESNVSVRSEYSPADYDYYRRHESTPTDPKDIIRQCMWAYDSVGIVHNVIDLMSDFTVQGIRIVHKDNRAENFCADWWRYIDGDRVSERIANLLYRCAQVFINTYYGKIPAKVEKEWNKAFGYNIQDVATQGKRKIPISYMFLNPLMIEPLAGDIGTFTNKQVYGIRLDSLTSKVTAPGLTRQDTAIVKKIINELPEDVKKILNTKNKTMVLDPDILTVLHYRKDDWQTWANPLIYPILRDVKTLNKMKLADLSALDGVISNIRLWNLGDFERQLYPTKALIEKLKRMLNNTGPGTTDIIWGPELKFTETQTTIHNYLGMTKYVPILNSIYEGLGVPPTLTGSSGEKGFTNNMVSMKTLLKRLQYGRNILVQFWTKQLKILQKAMGWKYAPEVSFDHMILSDEAAEKALLVQLWDRDIISTESLLNKLEGLPQIEKIRLMSEEKSRKKGKLPPKASPYHNPQVDEDLKKIILQKGIVSPSELDIQLSPRKEGEETFMEQTKKFQLEMKKFDPKGRVDDGRPIGSKDKKKRKQKAVKPLSGKAGDNFLNRFLWANQSYDKVSSLLVEPTLQHFQKKNLRSLTNSEKQDYEKLCFAVFCAIEPYSEITNELVYNILQRNPKLDNEILANTSLLMYQFFTNSNREPDLQELHQIQCSAYCLKYEVDDVPNNYNG